MNWHGDYGYDDRRPPPPRRRYAEPDYTNQGLGGHHPKCWCEACRAERYYDPRSPK